MTPVMQSKLYTKDAIHNGNCLAACLASLLDLPLWMVPPFEDMFARSDWFERVEEWLARMFTLRLIRTDGHEEGPWPEFYIASGLSPRGVRHSVIYRRGYLNAADIYRAGHLAHDPHPSGAGIASVEWCWHLAPIEANS